MDTTVGQDQSWQPGQEPKSSSIYSAGYRGLTAGIVVTIVLFAFEAMAVSTALPVTTSELGSRELYAWAFSGFFAAALVGMVVSGEVCDSRGPRLPFLVGVGTFAVGLLVAGLAPSMLVLVGGRVLQGFGGGAIIVAVYVIVVTLYPEHLRPAAFGVMASGWVVPAFVGPFLAGWVAEVWSWRAVFLGIAVLVVPPVLAMLPRLRRPDPGQLRPMARTGRTRRAFAVAGGVVALQYAGEHLVWASLAVLAVAVVLLAVGLPALLPAGTLRLARGLPTVVAMRGLLMGALLGAEAFIPLMLVTERDLRPALAGTIFTGGALSWALSSWLQSRVTTLALRWLLIRVGGALLATGIAIVSVALVQQVTPFVAVLGWIVAGFGLGLSVTSISVLAFAMAPEGETGGISASIQLADAFGSVLLVAVAGVLYASLHTAPGQDTTTFLTVFAVMAGLAVLTSMAAGRIRVRQVTS